VSNGETTALALASSHATAFGVGLQAAQARAVAGHAEAAAEAEAAAQAEAAAGAEQ
jgi:hypothetical protein